MIGSRLFGRKAAPRSIPESPGYGTWGISGEVWEPEQRSHYVDAYRDRVWVRRCVNLISESFTQVEIKALRGETELESHALLDLLKRPNPRDPATMFFESVVRWAEIVGEWYCEGIPNRAGGIAELYPLRSHLVRIKPGKSLPEGYVYDPMETGETVEFKAADPAGRFEANSVVAGRYYSPHDDWYGLAPLRAAKDDIVSEYFAVRYDHRFFRNSARPDVVVGFKGKLDRDSRRANKEAWKDFKGVDNAHKAAILDHDPSVHLLNQNQKDIEYLDGRRLSRENQCGAFGVPPVLVGILDRATYSNYREAKTSFWEITMLPKLEFFATWANFALVPYFEGVDEIAFDVSNIEALQESQNEKAERVERLIRGGVMMPAEGRDEFEMEPVEEPGAHRLYLPYSQTPIAGEGLAEEQAAKAEQADAMREAIANAQTANGNGNQPEPSPNGSKARTPGARKDIFDNYASAREKLLDNWTTTTQQRLAAVIRPAGKEVQQIVAGKSKVGDLERELEQYGWGELGIKMEEIVAGLHIVVWGEASIATESILGLEVGLGEDSPQVQTLLRELTNRPDGIRTVEGRLKEDVVEEVRFGISKGIPNRGIATGGTFDVGPPGAREEEQVTIKGIRGVFDEYQTWQAERIARTEAVNAYNRGSVLVMREAGVEYVDVIDGMEDAPCAEANGSRWTLDEAESNPYEHANCTRLFLPVIDTPKGIATVIRTGDVILPEQKSPEVHNHIPAPAAPAVTVRPTVVVKQGKVKRTLIREKDAEGVERVVGSVEEPVDDG